ncbi:GNAT family N-acetyltransferase [Rubrobacter tropicus]|uniref:GNAT family N-acetyltransferase n=1 Tax=Rubrobacter tropicus TaxID=2653851 RepID=A0A6G8Q7I8_9ACTN|nr:GNAT family N-acetyltransferase [Rubrobacter tropicus]QIN82287.1 GNAT family N-acetyltransferase [Rubrobacter tropicus]
METEGFTIRPGRKEDAAEAARLWMQSAEEHTAHDPVYATAPDAEKAMRRFLADLARNSYAFVFVATVEDQTVGFVSGELREGSPTFMPKTWASVDDVFVDPGHRNGGIGRALIASVEGWARQKGANGVSLQVAAANARGRKFYEDLGFREVSVYELLEFG